MQNNRRITLISLFPIEFLQFSDKDNRFTYLLNCMLLSTLSISLHDFTFNLLKKPYVNK